MTIPEILSPIRFPELRPLQMSDKSICREEVFQAALLISRYRDANYATVYSIDENATVYIYEEAQSRLWILGSTQALVCYIETEGGKPFFWRVESLLRKSRTESFAMDDVLFHLSITETSYVPPGNEILPDKDGYPLLLSALEKKVLIPAHARKILRHHYCQLQFKQLGFPEPRKTIEEALTLLVSTTCDTTLATVLKLHPAYFNALTAASEFRAAEKLSLEDEVKEVELGGAQEPVLGLEGTW